MFVSTTVGLSTIFLDTHWVTDVLGGWLAGALVMLALPATYGLLERWAFRAMHGRQGMVPPATRHQRRRDVGSTPRQHDLTSEMFTARCDVPLNSRSTAGPSS